MSGASADERGGGICGPMNGAGSGPPPSSSQRPDEGAAPRGGGGEPREADAEDAEESTGVDAALRKPRAPGDVGLSRRMLAMGSTRTVTRAECASVFVCGVICWVCPSVVKCVVGLDLWSWVWCSW